MFKNPVKELENFRPEGCVLRGTLDLMGERYIAIFFEGDDPVDYKNIAICTFDGDNTDIPVEGLYLPKDCDVGQDKIKETLDQWAICLNSPWSIADRRFVVENHVFDAYSQKDPFGGKYRAIMRIIGYEALTSVLYGYGDTEVEALQDCMKWVDAVQKAYNPDSEGF